MTDLDDTADGLVGKEIVDATGTLLGTVAGVDEEDRRLYVDPDPDPTDESWAAVGDGELVNYDNDWLGTPDYDVWDAGETDEFEEWPYTIDLDEVEEVTDEAVHLERVTLGDFIREVVPFLDAE